MDNNFDIIRNDNRLLYEYIRGSHLYGLNTKTSDIDTSGVYLANIKDCLDLGLNYNPQVSDSKHDNTWFEIKEYLRLLLKSNPTVVESLFVPKKFIIGEVSPLFMPILENKEKFISKQIFNPLFGYATQQIRKARGLNKKIVNPIKERLGPLDFCYTFYNQGTTKIANWLEHRGLKQKYCGLVNLPNMHDVYGVYYDFGNHIIDENISQDDFAQMYYQGNKNNEENIATISQKIYDIYYLDYLYKLLIEQNRIGFKGIIGDDKLSNELRLSSVPKHLKPICNMSYNQTGYTKHCIDYKNYKVWEKERNPIRYESNLNKNYDSKNIMHCVRLIHMGIELANGNGFNVERTWDRDFLLKIRNHEFEYDEILNYVEEKNKEFNELIKVSTLPEKIDVDFVNSLLVEIRKEQLKTL